MHFDPKNYKIYYDFYVLDNNCYILSNNLLKIFFKKVGTPQKLGQNCQKWAKNEKNCEKLVLNSFWSKKL